MWQCSVRGKLGGCVFQGVCVYVCVGGEGVVVMGGLSGCWRGLIYLFVQSSIVMTIINGGIIWVICCENLAHLMAFGIRLMSVMWVYPWLDHCVLKAWPRKSKILSFLCGEQYCVNVLGTY